MNGALVDVLLARVWDLAGEIGRLGRGVDPDSSLRHAVDHAAGHVYAIDGMLRPSAGQLVAWNAPGDDEAVVEALRLVDEHARQLEARLGGRA